MEFRSEIILEKASQNISHQNPILSLGSCFADEIGKKLEDAKFLTTRNPLGIFFNPISIAESLESGFDKRVSLRANFVRSGSIVLNYLSHSKIKGLSEDDYLHNFHRAYSELKESLKVDFFIITWGTAWIYRLKENNQVVVSCHKQDSNLFRKELIRVEDIVKSYDDLMQGVLKDKNIIITISPIRHIRDTLIFNQTSKSTLLLAAYELSQKYDNVFYFPAYEIMMDDLRDYRFYHYDLIHPNEFAVNYIWEKFKSQWFSEQTIEMIKRWDKLMKSLQHRPFDESSEAYKNLLLRLKNKIMDFTHFSVQEELDLIEEKISKIV